MDGVDQDQGNDGSVGQRLRRAREAEGLTLDDVATRTRIPIRHLRNIEDGNWDELPAITYTVGFGRSYANAVGLDGTEVGRELREQLGPGTRGPQVSPEFYALPDPARVPSRSIAWIAGIALVVLLALYLLVLRPILTRGDGDAAAPPQPEQSVQPQPSAAAQQPAQPENVTGQQVTLVATQRVWFRISDGADNHRVEDRTLDPQAQYQVPLTLQRPSLSTGRPQVLRAVVNGRDLGPLAPRERRITNMSLLANDLAGALGQQAQGAGAAGQPAGR